MSDNSSSVSRGDGTDGPALSRLATRLPLLIVAGLLVALIVFLLFGPALGTSTEKRNVILIVADTLRADHLGCYGFQRPTSPVIDQLAAEGLRCTDYSTVAPSTLASFTTLLTSMYTKDHGASRNGFVPFENLPTLAEAYRDAGYETAAFVSSYSITSDFAVNKGFDHFDEELTATTHLHDNTLIRPASKVTDAFFRWLNTRESDKPFFVMIHYFDPHWPYEPPQRFLPMIGSTGNSMSHAKLEDITKGMAVLTKSKGVPNDYVRELYNLYCAEIRYMDEEIGRVVKRFRGKGKKETETLFVFTSDHGETFWEHSDYFFHGLTVYETAISIPLIFNCPGLIPAGAVRDLPFSNIDLGPTLCKLNNVEIPETFVGLSFDSFLMPPSGGQIPAGTLRYSEATMPYKVETDVSRPNYRKSKSIRRGPWKYIVYPYSDNRRELFNIKEDPGEKNDLSGEEEYAHMVKAFDDELKRWTDDFDRNKDRDRFSDSASKSLEKIGY